MSENPIYENPNDVERQDVSEAPHHPRPPGIYPAGQAFAEVQTSDGVYKVPRKCPHRGLDLTLEGILEPTTCTITCAHAGHQWVLPSGAYQGRDARVPDLNVVSVCGTSSNQASNQGRVAIAGVVDGPVDDRCEAAAQLVLKGAVTYRQPSQAPRRAAAASAVAILTELHSQLRDDPAAVLPAPQPLEMVGADESLAETEVYDATFRIERFHRVTHLQEASASISLISAVLADPVHAPIPPDDTVHLWNLCGRIVGGHAAQAASAPIPPVHLVPDAPTSQPTLEQLAPLPRWQAGHHLYGKANRRAARLISQAADAWDTDASAAAALLGAATVEVQAITASMNYASAMSADEYAELVRPTMNQPAVPVPLTGSMNADHRAYRAAMRTLLAAGTDSPSTRDDTLVARLISLLSIDLVDLERHIVLTQRLVGTSPALDQNHHASAVRTLRQMYLARVDLYNPWLRLR